MTTNTLSIKNLRLLPADTDFLDRKIGSSGEIYYDRTDDTIRYFDGTTRGGNALAIDDLSNVSKTAFVSLANTSGLFGPNIHIHNTAVNSNLPSGDKDYVTFTVGTNDIAALYLTKYVGLDLIAFFAIQEGDAWTAGQNVNQMLTYGHLGSGGSVPVGTNILAGNPLQPLAVTLAANTTYTMWIQQTGSRITEYAISTNPYWVPATVDLPADYSGDPANPTILYQDGAGQGGQLTLVAGSNITITTDPITDTTTIAATVVASNSFTTVSIAGQDNIVAGSTTDTLTLVAGTGITLASNAGTDTITITNTGVSQNTFSTVAVAGQSSIVADSATDTLTLVAGTGITLTTDAATDTITITGTASTGNITFVANTVDSIDSTAITITPLVNFESDVVVGNEIIFADGSRQSTSAVGIPGPTGPQGPAGATGAGTGDVLSAGGGYVDNRIIRYDGTTGTLIQVSSASISDAGLLTAIGFSGDGSLITALNASELTSGTIPNARFPATLPSASGANLTALNATQLTSGTVPDARFPATLPAASGANLTALNATQLTSGTVPDARFPATLPSASGVNLTALNASNLGSGTVPVLRLGASGTRDSTTFLRGDNTWASTGASANSFAIIEVAGQAQLEADSTTDTLTLVAGANVTITTSPLSDTITIAAASGGVSTFSALTEAVATSLTIDKIYLPAITRLTVTNNGSFSYLFDQYGATENPTIYAIAGMTIAFNLIVAGHPFLIQDGTGTNYSTGLVHVSTAGVVTTGAAAQGQVFGTLYWKVPAGISGGYRYQCSVHPVMVGAITVKGIVSL
jgi:plastocyanin